MQTHSHRIESALRIHDTYFSCKHDGEIKIKRRRSSKSWPDSRRYQGLRHGATGLAIGGHWGLVFEL